MEVDKLLVVAHPDDEVMFFSPLLTSLSMRKLETVLLAVGRRAYVEAWRRWQAVVRFVKTEDSVLVFVAYMGAHRFKRACMSIITGNTEKKTVEKRND
jgi:hypothetical protein